MVAGTHKNGSENWIIWMMMRLVILFSAYFLKIHFSSFKWSYFVKKELCACNITWKRGCHKPHLSCSCEKKLWVFFINDNYDPNEKMWIFVAYSIYSHFHTFIYRDKHMYNYQTTLLHDRLLFFACLISLPSLSLLFG